MSDPVLKIAAYGWLSGFCLGGLLSRTAESAYNLIIIVVVPIVTILAVKQVRALLK